jgi:hypothetical protein
MGLIEGLAGLQKLTEPFESSGDGEKTTWLKVDDGKSVQIYFLQELDRSSPRYSEKNGLAVAAGEHVLPGPGDNYRTKAVCSMKEEDACYGCEQYRLDYTNPDLTTKQEKGRWRAKSRLYINVLVKPSDGSEPYVAVMSQGFGDKAVGNDIISAATTNGAITDRSWTLKRKGLGRDTSWDLTPSFKEDPDFDPEAYEVYDLKRVAVREVPYAEQADFFNRVGYESTSNAPSSPTTVEWV